MDWFVGLGPIGQAFIATLGTYLLTVVGTLPVLFFRTAPRRLMDGLMGAAGGIMVTACSWSLLEPAIEIGGVAPAVIGLLLGAAVLYGIDQALPHLHPEFPDEAAREGPKVPWRRSALLMLAISIHNFPEGMAVGVGYAGADIGATA